VLANSLAIRSLAIYSLAICSGKFTQHPLNLHRGSAIQCRGLMQQGSWHTLISPQLVLRLPWQATADRWTAASTGIASKNATPLELLLLHVPCCVCSTAGPVQGEYQLLDQLGKGAHGIAFKARHLPSNQLTCIKTVECRQQGQQGQQLELDQKGREVAVLAALQHPNIIR